MINKFFLI